MGSSIKSTGEPETVTTPERPGESELPEDTMDQLLRDVAATPESRTPDSAAPERGVPSPGQIVDDKYRVERLLGEGGMGAVFLATQLTTKKKVAIKWLLPSRVAHSESARQEAARRLVREAQAAARIRHDHCVEIYDVAGGPEQPYIVMEYLKGESLRSLIAREAPLSWSRCLEILIPVVDAVRAAHQAKVLHRDLKPDNILLEARGSDVRPKVLDFGISRLAPTEDTPEITETRTGTVQGTPAYMPLEQLRASKDQDERIDVYALGVVFYEMLSGHRPYDARNAPDYAALLASEGPRPVTDHLPELSPSRARAVMAALAPQQADRPHDLDQLKSTWLKADERRITGKRFLLVALLVLAAAGFALFPQAEDRSAQEVQPEETASQQTSSESPLPAEPAPAVARTTGQARTTGPAQPPPRAERPHSAPQMRSKSPTQARAAQTAQNPGAKPPPVTPAPIDTAPIDTTLTRDDFKEAPEVENKRPSLDRSEF